MTKPPINITSLKPRVIAAVEIEEENQSVIYTKIDPEVVKRLENIERMLAYMYKRDTGND